MRSVVRSIHPGGWGERRRGTKDLGGVVPGMTTGAFMVCRLAMCPECWGGQCHRVQVPGQNAVRRQAAAQPERGWNKQAYTKLVTVLSHLPTTLLDLWALPGLLVTRLPTDPDNDIRSNLTPTPARRATRRCPCSSNCALNFVVALSEWQRCSGERYNLNPSHLYEEPFSLSTPITGGECTRRLTAPTGRSSQISRILTPSLS